VSRGIAEVSGQVARASRLDRKEPNFGTPGSQLEATAAKLSETPLDASEEELLREAIRSLQGIRYGSVVLVKHDGRLVEVTTTVRIRGSRAPNENEKGRK
jgi:hypothetical protein